MVKYYQDLDATFSALSDPTRRAILATLSVGRASVSELARPYSISLPAVMKHLRVLEEAGLISQEKAGRVRQCSLAVGPLRHAAEWLSKYRTFWENQFDALDRYLTQQQTTQQQTKEITEWPKRKPRRKSNSN